MRQKHNKKTKQESHFLGDAVSRWVSAQNLELEKVGQDVLFQWSTNPSGVQCRITWIEFSPLEEWHLWTFHRTSYYRHNN